MKKTIIAVESKTTKRVDIDSNDQDAIAHEQARLAVAANRRALQKYDLKQQFLYPIERITMDKLTLRYVKFPGADEAYPNVQDARMRFCTTFYPNALGGPLYVDEPRNEVDTYRAYERNKVMKKLGHRHLILEKDTTYEMLLEQLGEL